MSEPNVVDALNRLSREVSELKATTKAKFEAQETNISLFWAQRWPKVERAAERVEVLAQDVHRLATRQDEHSGRLRDHEQRLTTIEASKDTTRSNVALAAGVAGFLSSLTAIFKPWTWGH